jgi:excisionase family DNA binding protein
MDALGSKRGFCYCGQLRRFGRGGCGQEGFVPTPGVEPRFYTLEDVATVLNVRVAQVYALVRSGELPAVKLGGRGVWRVDRNQLEAYIERMHQVTAEWARKHPLIGAPEET